MRLEPRQLQQELKEGLAWPVYWIFGPETYRIREVCAALSRAIVGDKKWSEDRLEGAATSAQDVVAAAQSIPLGGGTRVVWVRDAHLIREPDAMGELFGARQQIAEIPFVTIFIAKDLDGRKKFSKALVDKAAVVACETIPEESREAWVASVAKERGIQASRLPMELLTRSEPWSMDWVSHELEKWELSESAQPGSGDEVLVGGGGLADRVGDQFIEAFLERRALGRALDCVSVLAGQPEQALPLLGLLAWNVRMMGLMSARSRSLRLAPFLENRLRRAVARWHADEIQQLQSALASLDFSLKQTPQEPVALWGVLVHQFCRQ